MKAKISLDAIKQLRDETGAPIGDVRSALEEAGGDPAKARTVLRKRGAELAAKRGDRATGQGRVESYIHHDGKLGALVEVNCETDFVARTDDFKQFCREVAMHVAAAGPQYIKVEDVPASAGLDPQERKAVSLLEQPFVKDQGTTVGELLKTLIAKTGENVVVRRVTKFAVGGA
jgi:elongation factor Ts